MSEWKFIVKNYGKLHIKYVDWSDGHDEGSV